MSGWDWLLLIAVVFAISFSCGWAMARNEWPWQSWRRHDGQGKP